MIPSSRDAAHVAGQTAVLFVGMQKVLAEPGRDPERGAGHRFHAPLRAAAVPDQKRILAAARASGVQVLHAIIRSLTRDGRTLVTAPGASLSPHSCPGFARNGATWRFRPA